MGRALEDGELIVTIPARGRSDHALTMRLPNGDGRRNAYRCTVYP